MIAKALKGNGKPVDSPFSLPKTLVLIGMPGAGKSSVGRRLASRLDCPFADSDQEIEKAAGMTIPQIFETYGEPAFRDGERKVIARLLGGEPKVLSTGGGAFMNEQTRALIKQEALSVWIQASFDTLFERVSRTDDRPLLRRAIRPQSFANLCGRGNLFTLRLISRF